MERVPRSLWGQATLGRQGELAQPGPHWARHTRTPGGGCEEGKMRTYLKCEQNMPEQRARRTAGRQDLEGRRVRLACRRAEKQARRQAAQSALL